MNFPRGGSVCDAALVALGDADGAGIAVEETVSLAVGEFDAAVFGVALGVIRGAGVALGTSNRPRRCDAVGKGDAEDIGGEVAAGVGDCSNEVALRGVSFGSGVEVGAADGASVGDRSVEVALRGVVFDSGADVAATEGACAADIVADGIGVVATGVDEAGVSEP